MLDQIKQKGLWYSLTYRVLQPHDTTILWKYFRGEIGNKLDCGSNLISASVFTVKETISLALLVYKFSLLKPNIILKYVSENMLGIGNTIGVSWLIVDQNCFINPVTSSVLCSFVPSSTGFIPQPEFVEWLRLYFTNQIVCFLFLRSETPLGVCKGLSIWLLYSLCPWRGASQVGGAWLQVKNRLFICIFYPHCQGTMLIEWSSSVKEICKT